LSGQTQRDELNMGVIRFRVVPGARLADWPEAQGAYLTGADGRIFSTRVELEGDVLGCRRSSSESCKLHVAYPVSGFGQPVLSTASLPERETPYVLAVELARGRIVQLRNQAATWEQSGLQIPAEYQTLMVQAQRQFGRAASGQTVDVVAAVQQAEAALVSASQAAKVLVDSYAQQSLKGRQRRYPQLATALGCQLGLAPLAAEQGELFSALFGAVRVPMSWSSIEEVEGEYQWELQDQQLAWCEQQRLLASCGPLLDLSSGGLPMWLARWEHDPLNLQSFVCDFVETAMTRYLGRVRVWEIASRFSTGGALTLNEEQRLTLVARALEVAGQVDEESQVLVRIDQPWGEYQVRGQHRLSPLQVVDALLRSQVGLSGVNLEIASGYGPRECRYRDLFDVSRLIDSWSVLGIPLYVTVACPSSAEPDPTAVSDLVVNAQHWPGGCTEASQAQWLSRCLPLLLSKPAVAGVFLEHFSDAVPHEYPHAGLLRRDESPKQAVEALVPFRRE
jgi:hypothetical protein